MFAKHGGGKHANTPVGHLIDVATDGGTNTSENWTMYMEICDVINASEEGPKEATKAIRKKFATKHASTITYALALLETCVKNCGKRFHLQIATKEFLQDLVKVINPKNNPSMATQLKVLSLIQTWAHAFSKYPELKEINKTYQELKTKGVEFPPLDPDQASAANIPPWAAPTVAITEVGTVRAAGRAAGTGGVSAGHPSAMAPGPYPPAPHGMPAYAPPMGGAGGEMTTERVAKLRTELQTVQQNCRVFGDMLTEVSNAQESQSDIELLEDLNSTCRQMQKRIMELIQSVQHEDVTVELLTVNDELNNVFLRYDRYQRLRAGRAGEQPPPAAGGNMPPYPPQSTGGPGARDQFAPPSYMPMPEPALYDNPPFSQPTRPPGAPGAGGPAIANLIDFGEASPPAASGAGQPSYNPALGSDFANLNISSSSAAARSGSDDFDSLAHSRQTTTGTANMPLRDKESDFVEMEKWLLENPTNGVHATPGGESATNAEFERFLSQRQREAEKLPNAGTTTNQASSSGPKQDEPLFSL